MSEPSFSDGAALDPWARRVDQLCDRWETAWKAATSADSRPRIEDFLDDVPEPNREALLRELIPLEVYYRQRQGEVPQAGDYRGRFPALDTAWLAVAALAPGSPDAVTTPMDPVAIGTTAAETAGPAAGVAVLPDPGCLFGDYELLEEVARGGMGIVYRAWQLSLQRTVALKMILGGPLASPAEVKRFRTEAEAVARLQHPNIVQIHEVGAHRGLPYISLEFCEGGSLAKKAAGTLLPARQAAGLVETVSRAVHAAHQHNIVHRDLKPANVLLTADGVPKVTDFGLAKRLDLLDGATQTGTVMGTAAYMAPEQAAGKTWAIGPRSDVYALGTILYQLLTGRVPFQAATALETLQQVREREPRPPRSLNRHVDPELEAVCLRCLEKEPHRRYRSAEALADDLGRWLAGKRTDARPRRWLSRVGRALRRHAVASTLVALLGLLALTAAIVRHVQDPEHRLAVIEGKLREGQSVTLIGATGPPEWCHWATEGGTTAVGEDGTFNVQDAEFGVLELLPDPQRERYRFRAEVRLEHMSGILDPDVGIYFGHSAAPGGTQSYCRLAFNDLIGNPGPARNFDADSFVVLQAQCHLPRGLACYSDEIARLFPFRPARGGVGRASWRRLAVEVTPDNVRVSWEGRRSGRMPRHKVAEAVTSAVRDATHAANTDPGFDTRGALGLYVYRATASFRFVAVEALGEGD
jgi:serine/threonine-protein kinase